MDVTLGTEAWYAQVTEDIIEPERPIIDPHHHLWPSSRWTKGSPYLWDALWADTQSGHNDEKQALFYDTAAKVYRL